MEEMKGATESSLNHQSITRRAPTKGKCYSQESKRGTNSKTYRVKQVRAKHAGNGAEVPLLARNTGRVPTLSEVKEEQGKMAWIGDQVRLERRQGSLSRVFIY
jgi:hypothetical protein